jgi:hypothetical protein
MPRHSSPLPSRLIFAKIHGRGCEILLRIWKAFDQEICTQKILNQFHMEKTHSFIESLLFNHKNVTMSFWS